MADLSQFKPNPGQKLCQEVDGQRYGRYPIKTKLITPQDDIKKVVRGVVENILEPGDIVGISEKAMAISQGRAYHKKEIKPSWLAQLLVRFVTKSNRGVGISSPETFQLAIEECGYTRIILGAMVGGLTKLVGIRGVFYHIAGNKARLIDGAAEYVIPPYNEYVSKGPSQSKEIANQLATALDASVAVIDINDYGGQVVGSSDQLAKKEKKLLLQIMADNPLGQTNESTPIVIIRKVT